MTTTCANCRQPTTDHGGPVCRVCTQHLINQLTTAPTLVDHLNTTLARQGSTGPRIGPRTTDIALPFGWHAADALWSLHNTLTAAAHTISRHTPHSPPPRRVHDADRDEHTIAVASWLHQHTHTIRNHPDAARLVDELLDTIRRAHRAIDRRPEMNYAGPCDRCGEDLLAPPRATHTTCPCGATYNMTARRAWLLDRARDHNGTATEISQALSTWCQQRLPVSTICTWARRGRLVVRGYTNEPRPRPLYRVGDVADLAQQRRARHAVAAA